MLELLCQDFPLRLIRKVVYSLPASFVALNLRRFVKAWQPLAISGCIGSTSSADRRHQRIEKARALLARHDQDYRAFLKKCSEEHIRGIVNKHGEAIRLALGSALALALHGKSVSSELDVEGNVGRAITPTAPILTKSKPGSGELNLFQLKWLANELGVDLNCRTTCELHRLLLASRSVALDRAVMEMVSKYGDGPIARNTRFSDKVHELIKLIQRQ